MAGSEVAELAASQLPSMFQAHYNSEPTQIKSTGSSRTPNEAVGSNAHKAPFSPLSPAAAANILSSVFTEFQEQREEDYETMHLKHVREAKAVAEAASGIVRSYVVTCAFCPIYPQQRNRPLATAKPLKKPRV
jgi:hypothetical protein